MFKVRAVVKTNFISEHGDFKAGQEITINDAQVARGWLESGLITLPKPGPAENKMLEGAPENKGPKPSGTPTTGRSTASPSSSVPGPEQQSFALPGGNPIAPTSIDSSAGEPPAADASSSSTTATDSPRAPTSSTSPTRDGGAGTTSARSSRGSRASS